MTNRLLAAIESIITRMMAPMRYFGVYRYTVTAVDGQKISAKPRYPNLPPLSRVDMAPGVPGTYLTPDVGSIVRIAFEDGDPASPIVVSYDRTHAVVRMNNGNSGVSRIGDHGNVGSLAFVQTSANLVTITYTDPDSVPVVFTLGSAGGLAVGGTLVVPLTSKLTEGAADVRA